MINYDIQENSINAIKLYSDFEIQYDVDYLSGKIIENTEREIIWQQKGNPDQKWILDKISGVLIIKFTNLESNIKSNQRTIRYSCDRSKNL